MLLYKGVPPHIVVITVRRPECTLSQRRKEAGSQQIVGVGPGGKVGTEAAQFREPRARVCGNN